MKRFLYILLAALVSHSALSQAAEPVDPASVPLPKIEKPAPPAGKAQTRALNEPTYFHTYLHSTSLNASTFIGTQSIGYLTRAEARVMLTVGLWCSEAGTSLAFPGTYVDRYNCPFYNGVVAVGWQPGVLYSPFVWYYFLMP